MRRPTLDSMDIRPEDVRTLLELAGNIDDLTPHEREVVERCQQALATHERDVAQSIEQRLDQDRGDTGWHL